MAAPEIAFLLGHCAAICPLPPQLWHVNTPLLLPDVAESRSIGAGPDEEEDLGAGVGIVPDDG